MKLLLVQPGADFSIADINTGLAAAFERLGVELVHYNLSGRLERSSSYLMHLWRKAKREGRTDLEPPSDADVKYLASIGILEKAMRFMPDWVFIVSSMYLHPDAVIMLRRAGLRIAILFTEAPYDDKEQLRLAPYADVCWVNERSSVAKFREVNPWTYYYQHALDPDKHIRVATEYDVQPHDVVFVGTGFQERIDLLSAVDWTGIDLGLYGTWALMGSRSKLREHLRGGAIQNDVTAALYRKAKVGLNLHRTSMGWGKRAPQIEGAESIGPRCYELAATGCFFVSDYRSELADVFGAVVPTFGNAQECEEVIRYYLAHEDERQAIAAQLPALAAAHTFDARAQEILRILEAQDELAGNPRPV